jgi:hypothetical protein
MLVLAVCAAGIAATAAVDARDRIRDNDPTAILSVISTVFCVVLTVLSLRSGLGAL